MKLSSLEGKRILIWGLGREGLASADFIRYHFPAQHFIFAQDSTNPLPATILKLLVHTTASFKDTMPLRVL